MLVASDSESNLPVFPLLNPASMYDSHGFFHAFFPRDSKKWKTEYNARTSAERSNKREKFDFLLENGRNRSIKMWYCRLYHIVMLQHLDAWNLLLSLISKNIFCRSLNCNLILKHSGSYVYFSCPMFKFFFAFLLIWIISV